MVKILEKRLFPIINTPEEEKIRLSELNKTIDNLFEEGRIEDAYKLRPNSIERLTILYGPWLCNFRCPNYCYTKGTSNDVLTTWQTIGVIEHAKEFGAKLTYWPGEGELTLLKNFWDIMDYQARQKMPAVLFTNGSIFHEDKISIGVLDLKSDELIQKLREEYPELHLYVKFWSSDPVKAAEMVGVNSKEYPYESVNGRKVPLALAKLYDGINKERLGVEVMVSRENYDDVVENIIPTINELGIYGYVEPVTFSGNARGREEKLDISEEQHKYLDRIFASGGEFCKKRQSVELVVKGSKLAPGIALPYLPRAEDVVIDESGRIKDLFEIYHNEYFREKRRVSEKLNACMCRYECGVKGSSGLLQIAK